jgi:hypothetical protein
MGLCSASELAPSAYLASRHASAKLSSAILDMDELKPDDDLAVSASSRFLLLSDGVPIPETKHRNVQRKARFLTTTLSESAPVSD